MYWLGITQGNPMKKFIKEETVPCDLDINIVFLGISFDFRFRLS